MSKLEQFHKARVYLSGLYRDKAEELAAAIARDPASNHHGAFTACSIVWNALVDIENAIRAEILAGDAIDDYYRQGEAKDNSHG